MRAKPLGIVNPFNPPYEVWETREPTQEERLYHYTKHGNFFPQWLKLIY